MHTCLTVDSNALGIGAVRLPALKYYAPRRTVFKNGRITPLVESRCDSNYYGTPIDKQRRISRPGI